MKKYLPRIADDLMTEKLSYIGAVIVEGPKWCGKTTMCEQHAQSVVYLSEPDRLPEYLRLAGTKISELLKGARPRLFDEWQEIPELWDAIRFDVDHHEGEGHFILTGSAVVQPSSRNRIRHSGTGRFSRLKMRPMTLWESKESSGTVSIESLMRGESVEVTSSHALGLDGMAEIICRGGWPAAILKSGRAALNISRDYFGGVVESDMSKADGVVRDPSRVRRLLRSYARLQGTQSSIAAIRKDIFANDVMSLDEDTIYSYLKALEQIFVIEDVQAWTPSLRAKDAVRSSDTRYFIDPSIATSALGIGPGELMKDLRTFGFLFETLCMRDLRTYMESFRGSVSHYRDKTGLECDAVLTGENGAYAVVEIKLGGDRLIDEGAESLNRFLRLVNSRHAKPPVFRMVLTAVGEFAYTREDGVVVCPLSALRP